MKTILTTLAAILFAGNILAQTNIIYANPASSPSQQSPCGFSRLMIANYVKPSPTWGWYASTKTGSCNISCPQYTNKVCLEAGRADGMSWHGTNSLTFTPGTNYPCRFTIYFPKSVPTNPFALTTKGFKP